MKTKSNESILLIIVGAVALLAITVLLISANSTDMTGQATSLLKFKKTTVPAKSLSTSCTDSDGGIDSYMTGTITGPDSNGAVSSKTDICRSASAVSEWYCETDGTIAYKPLDCKYGFCVDGECLTESEATAYAATQCSDSDGGQDYFIGGTATLGTTSETDYCLTETTEGYPAGYLYETSCSGNMIAHIIINCQDQGGLDCTTTASGDACRETTSASTTSTSGAPATSTASGTTKTPMNLG